MSFWLGVKLSCSCRELNGTDRKQKLYIVIILRVTEKKHFPQFFFGQIWAKKVKASVLTENWYTWYLGSADSKCGLRFFKFRPQNPFLGKCGPKMSKLTIFPENWHTWHLDDADSYSNTSF